MRIVSVNVGLPRSAAWDGRTFTTGIFKQPVTGPIAILRLGLDGDGQADPSVHGGNDQAVYIYPTEHYPHWQDSYPDLEFPWGFFGENLSTTGLLEDSVRVGDRLRVGTAELEVTSPRQPCNKLEMRFGQRGVARRFVASGLVGFYLRVIEGGMVATGDTIERIGGESNSITITEMNWLGGLADDSFDRDATRVADMLRCALSVKALPASWRDRFQRRLDRLGDR